MIVLSPDIDSLNSKNGCLRKGLMLRTNVRVCERGENERKRISEGK